MVTASLATLSSSSSSTAADWHWH